MKAVPFDVEEEMTKAVSSVGGKRVTEILGRAPGFENADYYFPSQSIVAELKCLDNDKMHDGRMIKRASELYKAELLNGRAPVVVFGEARLTTEGFSKEFHDKIGELYLVSVERLIRKAERQIVKTAHALKVKDPLGLFLIANNNHTALDPQHLWILVHQVLQGRKYEGINAAALFSGNLSGVMPGMTQRIDYWVDVQRPRTASIDEEFLARLRLAWAARLEALFESTPKVVPATRQDFWHLESRKGELP